MRTNFSSWKFKANERLRLVAPPPALSPVTSSICAVGMSCTGCSGCDRMATMGAPVEDYPVTIGGVTVPASQVFSDAFLNARTRDSVQRLASGLLSGSSGAAPVLNDDGSVTVKGLAVVPPGGAKLDALERVLLTPAQIPAKIPVSSTPASVLAAKPANWWTGVAKANTTDIALVKLEQLIRENKAAVTSTGAVVGPGLQPSTGSTRVYVPLQPAGAVDVAAYQATGGRLFAQTSPTSLTAVSPTLSGGTSNPQSPNFFSNLLNQTLATAATAAQQSILGKLLPAPPPLQAPAAPGGPVPLSGTGLSPSLPPSLSPGSLGIGFPGLPTPPVAPLAPVAPVAPQAPAYGGGNIPPLTLTPNVPTSGNIVAPPSLPSTLPQAPVPPALPMIPGIPATSATGAGTGFSGMDLLTSPVPALPSALSAPPVPVAAGPDWGKIALAAGVVAALGFGLFAVVRGGRAAPRTVTRYYPVRRRRRAYA